MFCRNGSIRKYAPFRRKQSAPRRCTEKRGSARSPCNARTDFGFPLRERISALASCCKTIDTCLIKMRTRPKGKLRLFCCDGSIRKYAPSRRKQSAPRGARNSGAARSPCNARTDFGEEMSCCPAKNYYSPQKKRILLLNTAEIRQKTQVRQPYCNLYAYAANTRYAI